MRMNELPRDGWFVTDDGLIYQLINGSPYLMDEEQLSAAVRSLKPGFYSSDLKFLGEGA